MSTECINVSLDDSPLEVLKGCSSLMSCLDSEFVEHIYRHQGLKLLADIMTDSISRLEDEQMKQEKRDE